MINKKLERAVIRQLGGRENLEDVYNHGAGAGYCGFTYYNDTCKFFKQHKTDIIALAEDLAQDLGEDMLTMISKFNCLKNMNITPYEVAKGLDGKGEMATQIQNAMAWFALEEIARDVMERQEGIK